MRKMQRILAIVMIVMLAVTGLSVAPVCAETSVLSAPDLTDAQATELVKKALEKFCTHNVIGYLVESAEGNSFYAYDKGNDIGIAIIAMDPEFMPVYKSGVGYELNDWYDLKKKTLYETYRTGKDKVGSTFYPMSNYDVGEYRDSFFADINRLMEKGFPLADEYRYVGKVWEFGPDDEKHICYRIEIPESDASLYLDDEDYLPMQIFIGVDDGEVYRIDEQRYLTDHMETTYADFNTHFCYPDAIRIPDKIRKKSILSEDYMPEYKGVKYYQVDSLYHKNEIGMLVYGVAEDTGNAKTSLAIPDTLPVRDQKYRIEQVGDMAFSDGGDKLERITIGDYVKKIGSYAFFGCTKLKNITIGKRIHTIGRDAFQNCKNLKKIVIKNRKTWKYVNSEKGRKKLKIGKNVRVEYVK